MKPNSAMVAITQTRVIIADTMQEHRQKKKTEYRKDFF